MFIVSSKFRLANGFGDTPGGAETRDGDEHIMALVHRPLTGLFSRRVAMNDNPLAKPDVTCAALTPPPVACFRNVSYTEG